MYLLPFFLLCIVFNHGTFAAAIIESLQHGSKLQHGLKFNNNNEISTDLTDSNNFYLTPVNGHVTPSPHCWRTAISIFQVNDNNNDVEWNDISKICASLPEMSMNKLALEISQCHLNGVGKSLYKQKGYDNKKITRDVCMESYIDPNTISECKKHLTPIGIATFTAFMTFVQSLCIRLTQEMILQNQKEVLYKTTVTHAELVKQSIHHLKESEQVSKNHLNSLIAMEKISNRMTHQLEIVIPNQISETVKNSLDVELDKNLYRILPTLLQHHSNEQYQMIHDEFEFRDIQYHQKYEDSKKESNRVTEEQTREIKELKEKISTTFQDMKPLMSLHILYHSVTNGYVMFTLYRYFVTTFIMIWILTYPKQNYPLRRLLYGIFFTEIFLEILLLFGSSTNYNNMINETDRKWYIVELRTHTTLIECVVIVAGTILLRITNLVNGKRSHNRDSTIVSMPTTQIQQSVSEQEVVYVNQHYNNSYNNNNNISDTYRSVRDDNGYDYTSKSIRASDVPTNGHHNYPLQRNDRFLSPSYDQMLVEYLKMKDAETTRNESRIVYSPLQHRPPDKAPEVLFHYQPSCHSPDSSVSHVHSYTTESPLSLQLTEDIFYDPMIVEESSSDYNEEMIVDSENNNTWTKAEIETINPILNNNNNNNNNKKKRSKETTDVTHHINKKQKKMMSDSDDV